MDIVVRNAAAIGKREGNRRSYGGLFRALLCPRRVRFARDSLLEEAVSSEPVSEAKFPASREFTGNFIDSELSGASTRAKKAINSVPYEPIPYASEQGICWGLAGN